MKPSSARLAFPLATALAALLATQSATAVVYYWDGDDATPGFGAASGTWEIPTTGTATAGWSTDPTGATVILANSVTTATTDSVNFGDAATGLGAGTIAVTGTVDSGNITFASGSGAIDLSGGTINLAAASTITVANTSDTISSVLAGAATSFTKAGTGSLTLSNTNTYTGTTAVSAGTLILSSANTISGATSVAATGTLQLGHATAMGTSTMTLASGANLHLRNDSDTTFTAPIAIPAGAATYNFNVNNAASTVTGKKLTLGNLTFATNTVNTVNVTGGNSYTLGLGTLSVPSGATPNSRAFTVNATSAAVTIAKFSAGSFGNALILQGGNSISLANFEMGSNSANSLTVSGSGTVATLGTTTPTNNRTNGTAAYTLTSGTLNLTTTTSLANVRSSGTATAPSFAISGGTLNNTSGSALTLAANSGVTFGRPTIAFDGSFTFGTALSTSVNDLNLGGSAIAISGNRTITFAGTGTTLTMGTMTNAGTNQVTTVNGTGNTLTLGGYNLSASSTNRFPAFNGTGNVTITGIAANGGGSPASGITYSGSGTLTLTAANTYTGATTVQSGSLVAGSNSPASGNGAFGNTASEINLGVAGGNSNAAILTGGAFTIARPIRLLTADITDAGTRVLTLGSRTASNSTFSGNITLGTASQAGRGVTLTAAASGQVTFSGVIQDPATMDATPYTVTKSGAGTVILSNSNTYTGSTAVNGGTLLITGASQATSAITFGGGILGLDTATPVTAAGATIDFTGQSVRVTGPTTLASYTLLTASSIIGTAPALAAPVPGYALEVVSNQLLLVQTGASAYDTWRSTNAPTGNPNDDFDGDGVNNVVEFMLDGLATTNDLGKLPTVSQVGGNLELNFTCLQVANRGGASLKLQYSKDLGITDLWPSHEVTVPDTAGVVGAVTFSIPSVNADPKLVNLKASIPASEALPGTKLFGRLMAQP